MTEEEILAGLRSGDQEFFERLVNEYNSMLKLTLYRFTLYGLDSDDLKQETWLKVHLYRNSFAGKAKFSTWLSAIAINMGREQLRRRESGKRSHSRTVSIDFDYHANGDDGEDQHYDAPDLSLSQLDMLLEAEVTEVLREQVDPLAVEHYLDEVSLDDLSERMGLPYSTIRSRVRRAIPKLSKNAKIKTIRQARVTST